MLSKANLLISTVLLLGIAAFIFAQFPHESLWYDETVNAYLAKGSWGTLWDWSTEIDTQPPLHFAALKLWGGGAGTSEFSLRLFSAFCGLLAAAATITLGRQLTRDLLSGWLAAIFLSLSGGFLYAVGEVRTYALAVALLAWSTAFLLRMLHNKNWWPVYTVTMLLLLFTHYTALAAIGVHFVLIGLWFLKHPRQRILRGVIVPFIIVAALGIWVVLMGARNFSEGTAFPSDANLDDWLDAYIDFYVFGQKNVTDDTIAYIMTGFAILAGAVWAAFTGEKRKALFAIGMVVLPLLALLIALTQIEAKLLSGRHAWMTWQALALLSGGGVTVAARRIGRGQSLLIIASLILPVVAFIQRGQLDEQFRGDFRQAFAIIERDAGPHDVLILRDGTIFTAAEYYESPIPYVGVPASNIINVNHRVEFFEAMDQFNKVVTPETGAIWVMAWQGDTMDPAELAYGIPEYLSNGQVEIWMKPAALNEPSKVSLFRYPVAHNKQPLFDHIVDFEGLLQVQTDGPSLLGYNTYHSAETCQAIVHSWWWRGERDYPSIMLSARMFSSQNELIDIDDQPLANYGFEQDRWTPLTPTLARQVLNIPCDVDIDTVRMQLVVYDNSDNTPPQQLDLRLQ